MSAMAAEEQRAALLAERARTQQERLVNQIRKVCKGCRVCSAASGNRCVWAGHSRADGKLALRCPTLLLTLPAPPAPPRPAHAMSPQAGAGPAYAGERQGRRAGGQGASAGRARGVTATGRLAGWLAGPGRHPPALPSRVRFPASLSLLTLLPCCPSPWQEREKEIARLEGERRKHLERMMKEQVGAASLQAAPFRRLRRLGGCTVVAGVSSRGAAPLWPLLMLSCPPSQQLLSCQQKREEERRAREAERLKAQHAKEARRLLTLQDKERERLEKMRQREEKRK